jgi:hypothetical protein
MHCVSRCGQLIKACAVTYSIGMENIDDRMTKALDEALEMTFPASDPIALTPATPVEADADGR